jgi:hypothetical protein
VNDFPLQRCQLWARTERANPTNCVARLYIPKYCGRINKVSTGILKIIQDSLSAQIMRCLHVTSCAGDDRCCRCDSGMTCDGRKRIGGGLGGKLKGATDGQFEYLPPAAAKQEKSEASFNQDKYPARVFTFAARARHKTCKFLSCARLFMRERSNDSFALMH